MNPQMTWQSGWYGSQPPSGPLGPQLTTPAPPIDKPAPPVGYGAPNGPMPPQGGGPPMPPPPGARNLPPRPMGPPPATLQGPPRPPFGGPNQLADSMGQMKIGAGGGSGEPGHYPMKQPAPPPMHSQPSSHIPPGPVYGNVGQPMQPPPARTGYPTGGPMPPPPTFSGPPPSQGPPLPPSASAPQMNGLPQSYPPSQQHQQPPPPQAAFPHQGPQQNGPSSNRSPPSGYDHLPPPPGPPGSGPPRYGPPPGSGPSYPPQGGYPPPGSGGAPPSMSGPSPPGPEPTPPLSVGSGGGAGYPQPPAVNGVAPGQYGQGYLPPPGMQGRYPPTPMTGPPQPMGPPGGGYGAPPQSGGPMGQPQPAPMTQPQQQMRRLDPDMMPSPIQVIDDDRKNRDGLFHTNTRGQVPPLVTTSYVTVDQGNCGPRFIRSSMYNVPSTPDMMKNTHIPFTLTISPFAKLGHKELPIPISDAGGLGPVRCNRCKAYMCPFMQFIDGGRRFQCGFCRALTEVPPEYFAHLDHTGSRVDKYERPELHLGTYELIATQDYCRDNKFPNPPAFIFLLDVSYNNVKSGMVHLLCQNMKSLLRHLPKDFGQEKTRIRVGFITYSNTVHFYNLKSCLAQPQVLIVSDVGDMFVPLLDGFLVDVDESEALIDSLMEQIPLMFADSRETETILGPAIKAGLEALKAAETSGKLFVFHSSLPIAEAPGKLKNRDDRKLLGTDKEKTILQPQSQFYTTLGQECVAAGCSVDLYAFPNAYIDIATISQVCRITGGQLYKYIYFQADLDGYRFLEDLRRGIAKQAAFDAIMRVRTSTGVRPVEFFGSFYMSNTTDVELSAVDPDKAICVEIKHDDKLADDDSVFIQAAILYTSIGGQRRLRLLNLSLNTCSQMADLYRSCELDAIMNYFSKHSLQQLCDQAPKAVKEKLIRECAECLACYRKNCASPSSAGQLILPECMKLYPLYVNCLLKSDAISGGSDVSTDSRSFGMHVLGSMDVSSSLAYVYPRLLPLHTLDLSNPSMPAAVRCSADKIHDNGIYLLENGIHMFLWIGLNANPEWIQSLFGVQSAAQIDIDKTALLEMDNPISQAVRAVINEVQQERARCLRLTLVRQRDKLELVFKQYLVEDKGLDGSPSYVDFLCHMHKQIRQILD